ncbi:MAG: hypothetical protein QF371_03350 [Flavobacteriales bacterium]|nr:hypothetical protein [Flavobacteriales bacterium]
MTANKYFTILFLLNTIPNWGFGQTFLVGDKTNFQKVDSLLFYGYDTTKSKVTDPKRAGQPLASYMQGLVAEMVEQLEPKHLKKWLRVESIEYVLNPTYLNNLSNKDQLLFYPDYLPDKSINVDTVKSMIERYAIEEKEGTGFVVIYEYFSRDRKSVSGYGCVFDIESREIEILMHNEFRDSNSFRSFRDYWVPARYLVKTFTKALAKPKE